LPAVPAGAFAGPPSPDGTAGRRGWRPRIPGSYPGTPSAQSYTRRGMSIRTARAGPGPLSRGRAAAAERGHRVTPGARAVRDGGSGALLRRQPVAVGRGRRLPEGAEPPPDDAERRNDGDRHEHARRARDLAGGDDPEDHERRVELDPPRHDGWARDVVLHEPPAEDEHGEEPGVRVPAEQRHADHD